MCEKMQFVCFMKEQVTRKKINLPKSFFFVNGVRAGATSPLLHFIWSRSKQVKHIFGNEKCKVTFEF